MAIAKNHQPIWHQYDLQVKDYLLRDSKEVVELRPMTTADGWFSEMLFWCFIQSLTLLLSLCRHSWYYVLLIIYCYHCSFILLLLLSLIIFYPQCSYSTWPLWKQMCDWTKSITASNNLLKNFYNIFFIIKFNIMLY